VLEADAGRQAEAEPACVLGDAVDAEALTRLVEEHVARLDDRAVEAHAAVPTLFPAAEEVAAELDAAGAGDPPGRRDGSCLERPRRHRDLEGRAGRELPLHGAVVQGPLAVLDERSPLVGPDAAREDVRVEGRVGEHDEDLAVARVEGDDRARRVAEGPLGHLLQVAVERERQGAARYVGDLLEDPHAPAEGVDLHLLPAGNTAQVPVPGLLEARLADEVARPVAARTVPQFRLAHLADVPEEVARERAEGVVAAGPHLDGDARQLELMRLERDHTTPVEVAPQHDALVRGALGRCMQHLVHRALGLVEVRGDVPQHAAAIVRVFGHEDDVERGPVVDQDLAVPVVDDAPGGGDADQPDAVVLRERAHLGSMHDLEEPQPGGEQREPHEDGDRAGHHAGLQLRRHLPRNDVKISRSHCQPRPRSRFSHATNPNTGGVTSAAAAASSRP